MRTAHLVVFVSAALGAVGCASGPAFQSVDLSRDLPPDAIQRYEAEWQALSAAGHTGSTAVLEYTNWWLPGLLFYYQRGVVTRMAGAAGPMYMVEFGQGLGPLSILYSTGTHATYSAAGERLSAMRMDTILLGHLAMAHQNEAKLKDGSVEQSRSLHLIHHLISTHQMHGQTYASLFTLPNAIGGTVGEPSGGHEGHAAPATPPPPGGAQHGTHGTNATNGM